MVIIEGEKIDDSDEVEKRILAVRRNAHPVGRDQFNETVSSEPIVVTVGGDTLVVYHLKAHEGPIMHCGDWRREIAVADSKLYEILCRKAKIGVYFMDWNYPELIWYGTMEDVDAVWDGGGYPNLWHGDIQPDGQKARVQTRRDGKAVYETWDVSRFSSNEKPPPKKRPEIDRLKPSLVAMQTPPKNRRENRDML